METKTTTAALTSTVSTASTGAACEKAPLALGHKAPPISVPKMLTERGHHHHLLRMPIQATLPPNKRKQGGDCKRPAWGRWAQFGNFLLGKPGCNQLRTFALPYRLNPPQGLLPPTYSASVCFHRVPEDDGGCAVKAPTFLQGWWQPPPAMPALLPLCQPPSTLLHPTLQFRLAKTSLQPPLCPTPPGLLCDTQ